MARLPKGLKPLPKSKEPIRARSPYFLFCDSLRAAHATKSDPELKGMSMAFASKVFSARWKALTPEERAPFDVESGKLKAQFKETRGVCHAARGTSLNKSVLPSGWKAARDTSSTAIAYVNMLSGRAQWTRPTDGDAVTLPRRPPNARRLFAAEHGSVADKDVEQMWRGLSHAERQAYEAKADTAKTERKTEVQKLRGAFAEAQHEADCNNN